MSKYLCLSLAILGLALVWSKQLHAEQGADFKLLVRIHLISSKITPLNTYISDNEVKTLITRVNDIWSLADIEWQIESIVREPLPSEALLLSALRGETRISADQVLDAILFGKRSKGVWNIYIVQDLIAIMRVPGVYLPAYQSLISSLRDPSGENDPGRILAHELGHSLKLKHVQCTQAGNLMSPACAAKDRTLLTNAQIKLAKSQAKNGEPVSFF